MVTRWQPGWEMPAHMPHTIVANLGTSCGQLLTSDNPAILDRLVLEWAPWDQEVGGEVEPA